VGAPYSCASEGYQGVSWGGETVPPPS